METIISDENMVIIGFPQRLKNMHAAHGTAPGHTCGECGHLITYRVGYIHHKCALGPEGIGPATDWRRDWPSCGRFDAGKAEEA